MPFQPGHKLAKGGARPGAGRPKKKDIEIRKAAAELAREFIEQHAEPVLNAYLGLATGEKVGRRKFKIDPATTRHVVDKLLPDEQIKSIQPLQIAFVQFNNTVQLSATELPVTVLAGNGNGHQASSEGMASPFGKGQDRLEFHNFKDVPGE